MPDSRRSAAAGLFCVFVVTLAFVGCATTAGTPKTITDPKQLVGLWTGYVPCRECAMDFRATLLIRDDSTWIASVYQNNSEQGYLGIVNGVLRWGKAGRWYGRISVVEDRGREYLSIVRDNGTVWTEFERAK
jgi:hypothetical protein